MRKDIHRNVKDLTKDWFFSDYISPIMSDGLGFIGSIVQPKYLCGSSGAESALSGFSLSLIVAEAIRAGRPKIFRTLGNPDEQSTTGTSSFHWKSFIQHLWKNILPLSSTILFIASDWYAIFGLGESKSWQDIFFGAKVGSAGHLQGAIFGIGCGIFYSILRKRSSYYYRSFKR